MTSTVGFSMRTPAKHDFINKVAGQVVGALSRPQFATNFGVAPRRLIFEDLTAGDGVPYAGREWRKGCSPGIFPHHARASILWIPTLSRHHEISAVTYESLLLEQAERLPELGYRRVRDNRWSQDNGRVVVQTINDDGFKADFSCYQRGDFLLVYNDPNHVHDFAYGIGPLLAIQQGANVLSFHAMGCNVGGMHRLDRAKRQVWFENLERVIAPMIGSQDIYLAAIQGDASRWGYAVVYPRVWAGKLEAMARSAFGAHGLTVRSAWLGQDQREYEAIRDQLFLRLGEDSDD